MLCAAGKSDNIVDLCAALPRGACNRVLEVGAGEGSILKCLDRKGFANELHALEISESGVSVIRSQGIKSLASCGTFDGYNIPFDDNAFDLIILAHVLEHVEFPRVLLRELRRTSAYQYIEVPLDNPLDCRMSALMLSYGHIDCYSASRLRHLLLSEGLLPVAEAAKKYQCAAMEYLHFDGNGRPRTPEQVDAFRQRHAATLEKFNALAPCDQEKSADVYCTLTRREQSEERESRLFAYAAQAIENGRFGEASLLADDLCNTSGHAAIYCRLGRLCASLGKPGQARSLLEKALALDATLRDAKELLATLPETGAS